MMEINYIIKHAMMRKDECKEHMHNLTVIQKRLSKKIMGLKRYRLRKGNSIYIETELNKLEREFLTISNAIKFKSDLVYYYSQVISSARAVKRGQSKKTVDQVLNFLLS